jgi:hypothetical protein
MLPSVDTKSPRTVAAFVQERFAHLYPEATDSWLNTLFEDVEALFTGKHPDYRPIDLRYHDLEHTLQATVCLALIFERRASAGVGPRLTARQFQFGISAALLHDAGYLKLRSDASGTGAKYTFCHVLRSCAFAVTYLPRFGATERELSGVLAAINCTGPTNQVSRLDFPDPVDRFTGCALATADYLAQMAASDYPEELEVLYHEFRESDDFVNVPREQRAFKSAGDLISRTPAFWRQIVLPKLQNDFEGIYRLLDEPSGSNAYISAIERNIALIEERNARPIAAAR